MPVSLAHVVEQAALALQAQAGCPVTYSHTHRTGTPAHFQVVVEYSEEDVGRLAVQEAEKLVRAALEQRVDWDDGP
jgi:cyanophycin synthetase